MLTIMERIMARSQRTGGAGRPRFEEGSGTKQVRLYEDLAIMIAEIIELEGGTTASLCDPLLRPQITARHLHLRPQIEKIRKAAEQLEAAKIAAIEQVRKQQGK